MHCIVHFIFAYCAFYLLVLNSFIAYFDTYFEHIFVHIFIYIFTLLAYNFCP